MNNELLLTEEELHALLTREELESYRSERPEQFGEVFKHEQEEKQVEAGGLHAQVDRLTARVAELERQLAGLTMLTTHLQSVMIAGGQTAAGSQAMERERSAAVEGSERVTLPVPAQLATEAPRHEQPAKAIAVQDAPKPLSRVATYGTRRKK